MDTPPTVVDYPTPRGSDKIWAILCHLSGCISLPFILPLIVYLALRHESNYVADNAREALNFHISLLIYSVVLLITVIGIALLWVVGIAYVVLAIVATIKASEGGCYRYPLTIRFVK